MPDPNNENLNLVYEELRDSIKTTFQLIQEVRKELKETEITDATLKIRYESLEEDVHILSRIVRDGNGSKSVVVRLALLEEALKDISTRDAEFRKFVYSKVEELKKKSGSQEGTSKYKREKLLNLLQTVPGAVSLVTIIIQYFLK